jgi:hypothetical protein
VIRRLFAAVGITAVVGLASIALSVNAFAGPTSTQSGGQCSSNSATGNGGSATANGSTATPSPSSTVVATGGSSGPSSSGDASCPTVNISLQCVAFNNELANEYAKLHNDQAALNAAKNKLEQDQAALQVALAADTDNATENTEPTDVPDADQAADDAVSAANSQVKTDQGAVNNDQSAVNTDNAAITQTVNQGSTQNVCNTTNNYYQQAGSGAGSGSGSGDAGSGSGSGSVGLPATGFHS